MPHLPPINTEGSANVVLDLIFRLKIKDIMTRKLITIQKTKSLRDVQKLMKENAITGVPVTDNQRLLGMVSVDDIVRALDGGYIEDSVEKHMTRSLTVLEDDMPVSLGISYFEKYSFGRFPVLNKNRELVGIVSSKDIIANLLVEINKEMEHLELELAQLYPSSSECKNCDICKHCRQKIIHESPKAITREFPIARYDFEHAGLASTEIKKVLKNAGIDQKTIRRVAVASYEMEMNQVVHSLGGTVKFSFDPELHKVELTAADSGPGIENVELALTEGWSTANDWIRSLGFGAGMGLPNIRRNSDEFSLQSSMTEGTVVHCIINLP